MFVALVLCSIASFAQGYYLNFTPQMNSELDSLTQTVYAELTDMAKAVAPDAAGALVQTIGGNGFGQDPVEPFPVEMENGKISITLDKNMWGFPFNEVYHIQLIVILTDADGVPIYDEESEDYVMDMSAYRCEDTAPAAWAINYPNNRSWEEEGLTFDRFYSIGDCTFYFTKEVTLPNDVKGFIEYETDDELIEEEIVEVSADMDEMVGLYAVTVNVKNKNLTASQLISITVGLEGVTDADGNAITVPEITAVNDTTLKKTPRQKKALENGIAPGNESVNIYNVQGILVKENVDATAVNELPAGMYIVNGKKVVVR